ncbi:outer membrane protein [Marinicella meishanensis]|uniref:outer membrane protein n=1 Tax=Marinicella meishanensis TaxID=2873263 RepID=UPI001CC0683F|nr:outer membrane beta-barrel protein [Marinicella sp. NBU2979]
MKKILLLAMGLGAANVAAADDFKGCYLGVSASMADSDYQWRTVFIDGAARDEVAGSESADDTAFGVQIGCDFYETDEWVLGAKLTANDNDLSASHVYINGTGPDNVVSYQTDEIYALVGRVGYKAWDNGLIYGNVGYVQSDNFYRDNDPSPPVIDFQRRSDRNGLLVGLGVELLLSEHFSIFAEYNHTDYDEKEVLLDDTVNFGTFDYRAEIDQDLGQFNLGVNWRF